MRVRTPDTDQISDDNSRVSDNETLQKGLRFNGHRRIDISDAGNRALRQALEYVLQQDKNSALNLRDRKAEATPDTAHSGS